MFPEGNCRIRFDFAGSASGISIWDQIPIGRISVVGSDSSGMVRMVGMVGMADAQPVSNNIVGIVYTRPRRIRDQRQRYRILGRDGRDGRDRRCATS